MKPQFLLLAGILMVALEVGTAIAATMPQDTWSYYGKKLAVPDAAQKKGIAIGGSSIFVGVGDAFSTTAIQKYSAAGAYVTTFPTTFSDVTGMACDSSGNLYVLDRNQPALKAFDAAGNLLWSVGSAGNGPGQFSTASVFRQHAQLAIDENNKIYVLDRGNSRVEIFDNQGNFQVMWGTAGTAGGQFQAPFGIVARNGQVVVVDTPGLNRQRLQSFTSAGVFLKSWGAPTEANTIINNERFALTPDGLLAVTGSMITSSGIEQQPLFDRSLVSVGRLALPAGVSSGSTTRLGAAFTPSGDLWMINGAEVWLMERRYASTDNPVVRNILPQPDVTQVAQRAASTLLDIDFKIIDADSPTAEVAALAFVNGGDTLSDVLRLATLVEGTSANVGPGQATNVTKRLTWNAAADWSSQFGEVQIEVLVKDQRDLLGIHWIAVPAGAGVTAFSASALPLEDVDLLSLWYWLIAKGDPTVALVNGEVKAVGGTYNGQTLASNIATTAEGREFLYAKLGVRAISAGELAALQAGNYGFSSSSTYTVVRP